ncbi:UbiA family prenyltransferase [Streptomyces sp. NPDC096012]|uniref:UbiA family prenyltransferase n=1 Tax=Streptomyces sp. NPDC096012 TaxID=3155684 RepID=UPI00336A8E80
MSTVRDWAELLRVPALFTVPGDALAGAAATGVRPGARTALAVGSSLCLYEAGMALNDWADRAEDAAERPHRPIPSGRIAPAQALTAAAGLTAAGLGLAVAAGRPAALCATALAGAVWAYDLRLKHTPAGPATMAAARALDVLLGAVATAGTHSAARPPATFAPTGTAVRAALSRAIASTGPGTALLGALSGAASTGPGTAVRAALPPAAASTGPGTMVPGGPSRPAFAGPGTAVNDAAASVGSGTGVRAALPGAPSGTRTATRAGVATGTVAAMLRALPSAAAIGAHTYAVTSVSRTETQGGAPGRSLTALGATAVLGALAGGRRGGGPGGRRWNTPPRSPSECARTALAGAYVATAAKPFLHAALNPSPPLTQRAVGGGIRALIPLQAALAARSGTLTGAVLLTGLAPVARRLARTVSPT